MRAQADTIVKIRHLLLIPVVVGVGLALALLLTAVAVSARPAPPTPAGGVIGAMTAVYSPSLASSAASRAVPNSCTAAWSQVSSPSPSGVVNALWSVAAVNAGDIWAVGAQGDGISAQLTLMEHWNGTAWSAVPSPSGSPGLNDLYGVAAVSANDVWAVGDSDSGNSRLTEHWNGAAWSVIPSPGHGQLEGVAAVGANDVWAVGYFNGPLREHWNGTVWSVVGGPNLGNDLQGVAAVGANDVWAVGANADASGLHMLAQHWNGTSWSTVATPNLGAAAAFLHVKVTALAANNLWAVGYYRQTADANDMTLAEHWNGTAWSVVPSPNPGALGSYLFDVAAAGANDVWAVGDQNDNSGTPHTLTEHWDGAAWSVVPSPDGGSYQNVLYGVAAVGVGDVWAVGKYTLGGSYSHTLVEHFSSASCTTPSPTPTLGPPNATPTPLTGFSDVHPADYFYTPVTYLASHGIISGYGDCTFRPYNNTTRSQMVKIVVLGFGIPLTTPAGGASTFQDVPPSNPFFAVIETAAAHTIVSGYTCGQAPAGSCVPPQNRPYFLPYANVTRGQLSKIDVVAAGWPVSHPLTPTFSDVLPGSAFYPFVETAVCHGVVSGYADHSFRPGANAIRGQIAKIVYLSVTNPAGSCPGATATPAP